MNLEEAKEILQKLDAGVISCVEKKNNEWTVNYLAKEAILFYLQHSPIQKIDAGLVEYADKMPLKKTLEGVRLVPFGSSVRYSAFVEPNVVIMPPTYINAGARVCSGSMIDSHVLIGSCAYVGKNVHVSSGTMIGGVLEPPQARPVIIEDNCFIGGNCGLYEGVLVEENSVIGSGTIINSSTPVIDVQTGEEHYGRVPESSVVIPGGRIKKTSAGDLVIQTPLIIKKRDEKTNAKTELENALRNF